MKVTTPEFRVSFCNVFTPVDKFDSGELKYDVTMLFDKDTDISPIKKAINEVIKAKWGDNPPKKLSNPIKKGDDADTVYEGWAGKIVMSAWSKSKPGICDRQTNLILNENEFYSGCYARATINVFAWVRQSKAGISIGLNNLQKLRDGDRLDGRVNAENDFDSMEDASDDTGSDDFFDN